MALLLHYTTTKLQELYFIHITIFTRKSIHQSSNKYVELPYKLNKVPWCLGSSIQVKINFRRQLTSLVPLCCFCFYLWINVIHCSCVVIVKLNKLQLARFVDGVFSQIQIVKSSEIFSKPLHNVSSVTRFRSLGKSSPFS